MGVEYSRPSLLPEFEGCDKRKDERHEHYDDKVSIFCVS